MFLKVSRILHAGYLFEIDGIRILFDPLFENPFSQNCYAYPNVQFNLELIKNLELDAVFISHDHDDHFSLESLQYLKRDIPIYIFSAFSESINLLHELGFYNVHPVVIDQPIFFTGKSLNTNSPFTFKIVPYPALDADVDSVYQIQVGGINILNVVDSWIAPDTLEKLVKFNWDLILWPFQTMREIEVIAPTLAATATLETTRLPIEWIDQLRRLNPKIVVPSSCQFQFESWSWYNQAFFPIRYQTFKQQMKEILPNTIVHQLNPGQSLLIDQAGYQIHQPLEWIIPVGNQNVEYQFNPNILPQPMSAIASNLPKLTFEESKAVYNYCESGIVQKYKQLVEIDEAPFNKECIWQLKIYDHSGQASVYQYKVNQSALVRIPLMPEFQWQTEMTEYKLFQALTEGESLTSIYIRITPDPKLSNADPLFDPLVRCLYEGVVCGYQKAQLKRIKKKR